MEMPTHGAKDRTLSASTTRLIRALPRRTLYRYAKRLWSFGICGATAFALFLASSVTWAATTTQINTSRANGLAWLYQHQKGDGSWSAASGLDVQSTSAVLETLLNAGVQRGNTYNAAVSRLANVQPASIDGLARQTGTLRRAGTDVTAYVSRLQAGGNLAKAWGSLPGYGSSPADTALALAALLDALPSYTNNDAFSALCAAILPTQRSGGGWSYLGGGSSAPATATSGSIVPTAYTILLLQKIKTTRFTGGTCGTTSYTLATSITNGVNFLLTKKDADNGFGENGTSGALETALAYLAIQAVNPAHAALVSAQDYLIATQQTNGSWADDPFQTALALQTFPVTILTDTALDGIPDVVKTVLGIGSIADGRALRPGNGQSIAGSTTSLPLASATTAQPFSYSLSTSGGTPPYSYSLLSGRLPDGLTLAANGAISGTPTTSGLFSFTYQVSDSGNVTMVVAGQINVNAPVDYRDDDVPTLPELGMIIFGTLLLGSMIVLDRRRAQRA